MLFYVYWTWQQTKCKNVNAVLLPSNSILVFCKLWIFMFFNLKLTLTAGTSHVLLLIFPTWRGKWHSVFWTAQTEYYQQIGKYVWRILKELFWNVLSVQRFPVYITATLLSPCWFLLVCRHVACLSCCIGWVVKWTKTLVLMSECDIMDY